MNVALVDDEYYALVALKTELEGIDDIRVVGLYLDGESLLNDFESKKPELVFVDIEMPKMNGLELFYKIKEIDNSVKIIFVTAFSKYALKAFEYDVEDFILKPATQQRLMKSFEKIQPSRRKGSDKRLEINCFGSISIFSEGQRISLELKSEKSLELISYLISEKGKFVFKEQLAEIIWPDLELEHSILKLYMAYYDIKIKAKEIGINFPIDSERGRMRIRMEEIESDVTIFDMVITSCPILTPDNIKFAEKAEALYSGLLFGNAGYKWAADQQKCYEQFYKKLLDRIMEYYYFLDDQEKLYFYNGKRKE